MASFIKIPGKKAELKKEQNSGLSLKTRGAFSKHFPGTTNAKGYKWKEQDVSKYYTKKGKEKKKSRCKL